MRVSIEPPPTPPTYTHRRAADRLAAPLASRLSHAAVGSGLVAAAARGRRLTGSTCPRPDDSPGSLGGSAEVDRGQTRAPDPRARDDHGACGSPDRAAAAEPAGPAGGARRVDWGTRSYWHGSMGHDDGIELPHVPGHELAGTVVETGPQVTRWNVGDRVSTPSSSRPTVPGVRTRRRPGLRGPAPAAVHPVRSFADLVALPRADVNLVRVPDEVHTESQPVSAAASPPPTVRRARRPGADWRNVVVHRCGGVALSAVMSPSPSAHCPGRRPRRDSPLPWPSRWAPYRCPAATRAARSQISPKAVPTSRSTRSAAGRASPRHSPPCGRAADTCRSAARRQRRLPAGRHGRCSDRNSNCWQPRMPASDYPELLARVADGSLDPGRLLRDRIGLAEAGPRLAPRATRRRSRVSWARSSGVDHRVVCLRTGHGAT